MSVTTVNYVRGRHDLTTTEFAVAYAMASHANPGTGKMCSASVATIARESGMCERSAQRIIRRLETKPVPVLFARGARSGGRHKATAYEFNIENPDPNVTLSSTKNPDPDVTLSGEKGDNQSIERVTTRAEKGDTGVTRKVLKVKEKEKASALEEVWSYYLAETEKPAILNSFTIKRRKIGAARLAESIARVNGDVAKAARLMKCAVDGLVASDYHMGREKGRPTTFNEWENIFGTTERFEKWLNESNR